MAIPFYELPGPATPGVRSVRPHFRRQDSNNNICKSPVGHNLLYVSLFITFVVFCFSVLFCIIFIGCYISNFLVVSSAVSKVCGSSAFNPSGLQTCANRFMSSTPYTVSYVTIDDEAKAKTLARLLVKEKLAACVNIIPKITSVYEWKGQLQEDNELMLVIKSRQSRLAEMTEFIKRNHHYDVCEVISFPIKHGNQPYLDWIGQNVPEVTIVVDAPSGGGGVPGLDKK